jgi:hypothetical protein
MADGLGEFDYEQKIYITDVIAGADGSFLIELNPDSDDTCELNIRAFKDSNGNVESPSFENPAVKLTGNQY